MNKLNSFNLANCSPYYWGDLCDRDVLRANKCAFFCFLAKRPPVEETANFLQSLLANHGPNYLEKLFGKKARDALAPLGGSHKVAVALSGEQSKRAQRTWLTDLPFNCDWSPQRARQSKTLAKHCTWCAVIWNICGTFSLQSNQETSVYSSQWAFVTRSWPTWSCSSTSSSPRVSWTSPATELTTSMPAKEPPESGGQTDLCRSNASPNQHDSLFF